MSFLLWLKKVLILDCPYISLRRRRQDRNEALRSKEAAEEAWILNQEYCSFFGICCFKLRTTHGQPHQRIRNQLARCVLKNDFIFPFFSLRFSAAATSSCSSSSSSCPPKLYLWRTASAHQPQSTHYPSQTYQITVAIPKRAVIMQPAKAPCSIGNVLAIHTDIYKAVVTYNSLRMPSKLLRERSHWKSSEVLEACDVSTALFSAYSSSLRWYCSSQPHFQMLHTQVQRTAPLGIQAPQFHSAEHQEPIRTPPLNHLKDASRYGNAGIVVPVSPCGRRSTSGNDLRRTRHLDCQPSIEPLGSRPLVESSRCPAA